MPKLSELKFKEYARENFFATVADCWPKDLEKIVKYKKEYIYFNIKVTYDKGGYGNRLEGTFKLPEDQEHYEAFNELGKVFGGNRIEQKVGSSYKYTDIEILRDLDLADVMWILGREKRYLFFEEVKDQIPQWILDAENTASYLEPLDCW